MLYAFFLHKIFSKNIQFSIDFLFAGYHDIFKAASDERNFDHTLHCCYEELMAGRHVKEHASYYDKFFLIHKTPIRGIRVDYNEEAISKHKRNHIGWFVLVSNHIKDTTKALEVYRSKDAVEKCFDDLKNDLDPNLPKKLYTD